MRLERRWLSVLLGVAACGVAPDRAPPPPTVDTVLAADGTPIVYDVRGAGDVGLVFIHCWACDRSFWREQLDAFAPGYRVLALDLPGHGASGARRAHASLDALAADVAAVVEHAGIARVVLVGHSLGGPVALLATARLTDRVEAVLCADALHDAEMEIPPAVASQMADMFEADFRGTMQRMVRAMFPDHADTTIVQWVAQRAAGADTAAVLALVRDYPNLDLRAAMRGAGVPIRCINAVPHPPAGTTTAIETNRRYGDFDAVLMDSVGHYLMLERPSAFNATMLDLLGGLGFPPGARTP